MQSLKSIFEVFNVMKTLEKNKKYNSKAAFYSIFSKKTIQIVADGKVIVSFYNKVDLEGFILQYGDFKIIVEAIKTLKQSYQIEIRDNYFVCEYNTGKFEVKINLENSNNQYENEIINENTFDLSKFTYCGYLTKQQINDYLKIIKLMQFDGFSLDFENIYIMDKRSYFADSYFMQIKDIQIKDCIISVDVLKQFENETVFEIYQNENQFIYKSENLEILHKFDNNKFKDSIKNILFTTDINFNVQIENFNLKVCKKTSLLKFDFKAQKLTIENNHKNSYKNFQTNLEYNLNCYPLDLKVVFTYENFSKLIDFSNLKFSICSETNKNNKVIIINNNYVVQNILSNEYSCNNIDFTNIIELQNKINEYESIKIKSINQITEVKEITKVKEIKPKPKAKTMDLKKEKIVKAPVSKYKKNIENEVKNEVKNEIVVYTPVIENDPVEVVNEVELSKTTVGPKFDIIDFIYMHCANELENLNYYNTDYRNNKLYLENFEFGFRSLENKIEVIELDYELNTKDYYFENKKDLLKFVRSKIEFDYNLTH